jgi:hypothetical protein
MLSRHPTRPTDLEKVQIASIHGNLLAGKRCRRIQPIVTQLRLLSMAEARDWSSGAGSFFPRPRPLSINLTIVICCNNKGIIAVVLAAYLAHCASN